jgi:hypothetical protein
MNDKDDIISILSAIDEINNKPKKRSNEKSSTQNSIPKLNQDLIIPSDVDRIIREAEEYKKTTINYVSTSAVQKRTETSKNENIFILTDEVLNVEDISISESFINNTKETLKSIYTQVEKQKKLFLDLKNYSIKIERESQVFKENYERLVIENNDLKTRLKIAKEQIVNYEANKIDLLSALDKLNEILSKSNVVGKIAPQKPSSESFKKTTKIESND